MTAFVRSIGAAVAIIAASPALAADISGTWDVAVREAGARNFYLPMTDGRLVIEPGGQAAHFNALTFAASRGADGLHLACMARGKPCGSLVLQLSDDRLTGKGTLNDGDGLARPVTLQGVRPAPRRAPRTIDFAPTRFHNVYSPAIAPVLHIQPGDTVHTRTLDSRGYDRDGTPRAPRGNPLTGPFYIEGAMPGDTLVVHLDRVRTNRDSAYQSNLIASSALEAGYLRSIAHLEGGFTQWKLDAAAGTASIVDPSARMSGYTVRLSPMLGCVGVAPPRDEVLGSGHLGPFGGNMDSPEVREGASLYIPVFQPGALLFLGDGHAQQGDGELPGQGLETSMDVQFRVDLIPGKALGQPRLENADSVMIMGTGGTLDAAMKSATTQMSRWLADTYGLTPHDIAPLLGTAMQYRIAEVVDSEFNVVAKISKDALARIRK
ncbi:MAG: acetamidase/formamidase family protein [Alphaproteobacteria bacterium]|nr:acetamidase/formamidase family protein [Alphaproteobacteria bacterium]